MRHSFNTEGRCVFCDNRIHRVVGTECTAWKDRTITEVFLDEVSLVKDPPHPEWRIVSVDGKEV